MLENDLEELAAASQLSSKGRSRTNGTFGSVPVPLGIERIISFAPPFTFDFLKEIPLTGEAWETVSQKVPDN